MTTIGATVSPVPSARVHPGISVENGSAPVGKGMVKVRFAGISDGVGLGVETEIELRVEALDADLDEALDETLDEALDEAGAESSARGKTFALTAEARSREMTRRDIIRNDWQLEDVKSCPMVLW
jgi:hypothetical protein